jgi:hypothetical protein
MPYGHTYTVRHSAAVSTAITVIQLASGATTPFEIVRASASQRGSTTSAQEEVNLTRKTAAATGAIAVIGTHVFKDRAGDPNPDLQLSSVLTMVIATAEGTDGDIWMREGFNVLNGWLHLPVPEKRCLVRAAALIGLKYSTAPANQNWDWVVEIRELG